MAPTKYRKTPTARCVRALALATAILFSAPPRAETPAEAPVIEFHRYSDKLAQRDRTPMLRIYGSGLIEVYFPSYKRRAGRYEAYLSPAELNRTLEMLKQSELTGSSAIHTQESIAQIQDRAAQAPGELAYSRSERTITVVKADLPEATTTVRLVNVQSDAMRMNSSELRNAAAVEMMLLDLCKHPGLVRVGPPRAMTGILQDEPGP